MWSTERFASSAARSERRATLACLNQSTLILRYVVWSGASICTRVRTGISTGSSVFLDGPPRAGRGAFTHAAGARSTVMMSSYRVRAQNGSCPFTSTYATGRSRRRRAHAA